MNTEKQKKRILMIAPHSFPVTDPEAIVNINLLRVLSLSGEFEIDLISRLRSLNYPSYSLDCYGVQLESTKVIEADDRMKIKNLLKLFQSLFHFGIIIRGYSWATEALKVAEEKIQTKEYDYVLTKNSPSLLLGWYIKKKYGIKWVASWNDPYPPSKYPFPYSIGYSSALIDKLLIRKMQFADVHVFPCGRLSRYMQSYLKIDLERCMTMAHTSSFHYDRRRRQPDGILRLIHSGRLLAPRDSHSLLQGLSTVINMNPDFKIRLTMVGSLTPSINETIRFYNLEKCVDLIPPIEYRKSLQLMSDYDVAVIVEAPVKEGIFLPTKVGDYVNMGIPVLAVSPEVGTINDLYKQEVVGYFASVNNPDMIAEEICNIYKDFLNNDLKTSRAEIPYSNPSYIIEQYLRL